MVTAIRPATITSRPVVFVAMKFERAAGLLAWAGWAATAVLLAAAAVLFVFNLSHDVLVDALTTDPVLGFVSIVFATLGRLIVSRHPRNIVAGCYSSSACCSPSPCSRPSTRSTG